MVDRLTIAQLRKLEQLKEAENDEMSVSLGTIFILNAVALFLFPIIGNGLEMSQAQFGIWSAIAIQDTSSVVGAATVFGSEALATATTVKLARALWIIPLALALACLYRKGNGKAKIAIPWFIFFFVGAAAVRTFAPAWILPSVFDSLVNIAKAGLTITLFLIGLSLSREMLRNVGWRPFALGTILWIIIASASLAAVLRFV
ncbi:putative sulfate exporter family transporter [Leptolyngbya sp. 15MV]|nr:putative sulfate exporter family transporter [Leptolyngbya sp. 15MV]